MQSGSNITAGPDLDEAYRISLSFGDQFLLDVLLNMQAVQAYGVGNKIGAISKLEEGIKLADSMGNKGVSSNLYHNLAYSVSGMGDFERAAKIQEKAITLAIEIAQTTQVY